MNNPILQNLSSFAFALASLFLAAALIQGSAETLAIAFTAFTATGAFVASWTPTPAPLRSRRVAPRFATPVAASVPSYRQAA